MSERASETPLIAKAGPYPIEVEAGKTYWWCACGRSERQPFCDGSHKACTILPVKYVPERSGVVWLCGCKRSADAPLCDGSHHRIGSGG